MSARQATLVKPYIEMERDDNVALLLKENCVQATSLVAAGGGSMSRGWNDADCKHTMKAICKAPRIAIYPSKAATNADPTPPSIDFYIDQFEAV